MIRNKSNHFLINHQVGSSLQQRYCVSNRSPRMACRMIRALGGYPILSRKTRLAALLYVQQAMVVDF